MKRHRVQPRPHWEKTVAGQGLTYHSVEGRPYWDEAAYWEFTSEEIDRLEAATAELQELCLAAGDHALRNDRLKAMHIPKDAVAKIRLTWEQEPPALYGRMDLAYDGRSIVFVRPTTPFLLIVGVMDLLDERRGCCWASSSEPC